MRHTVSNTITVDKIVQGLQIIVGEKNVLHRKEEIIVYECDGFTLHRGMPRAVVFVSNTLEVSEVVRYLSSENVPFIARGAGTGLSGGATPLGGEVIISLTKMKKLLRVDYENRIAIVEPGYINLKLSEEVVHKGLYYAPDPSSQNACTIGGNVAENAGGAHCFKHGVTTNHVLGLEVVMPDGEIVNLNGEGILDAPGYDLVGLFTGSEGTLGIVTKITVKLSKLPEWKQTVLAYFHSIEDGSHAVADIISAGIIPVALEMMDQTAIKAVERAAYPIGHPQDLQCLLLIEVEGIEVGISEQIDAILTICNNRNVREVKVASTEEERNRWWANRKTGFGAMGAISPTYLVQDGVIPPSKLPQVLEKINQISKQYELRIANIFHAGDGNLHPLILFDGANRSEMKAALKAGSDCLKACVEAGGTITGEHGVGSEKLVEMKLIFTDVELKAQTNIRAVFNEKNLLNRGKLFPS